MPSIPISEVRSTLLRFQEGYLARDVSRLDEFMQLFVQEESIEMIGVGASKRLAAEWFEGLARIREIVENDWLYWGDVCFDVEGAKITVRGETAWLSTTGTVTQTKAFDTAIEFHLHDMKAIFDRDGLSADENWWRPPTTVCAGCASALRDWGTAGLSPSLLSC